MSATGKRNTSKVCEIYSVLRKSSLLWKWRYTSADGCITDCAEDYDLFFQCAVAARARGYEPRSDWTGPCALIVTRDRRPKEALPQ